MLNNISRRNLIDNHSSYSQMSQGRGWISAEYHWHSALIPQPPLLSSWVSLSQINLSWLLYWQARKRIWQRKPVTFKPCVKPSFLAVFRSSLTATAVDGDIFRNLRREERAPLLTMEAQNGGKIKQCKEIKCTFRQALMDGEHWTSLSQFIIDFYYWLLI